MKEKVYLLQTCNTCKRIYKEAKEYRNFEVVDIKKNPLEPAEIDRLAKMAGGYEAIFNKQARKYRELGLKQKVLKEVDYRELLLEDYTFIKRPVFLIDNSLFVGNSKTTVGRMTQYLAANKDK